jgi:hypothetical protein
MNKSKCVLFLNGCIRDSLEKYCNVIKNILYIFSEYYDIDIYFHTWKSFDITNISKHEYAYNELALIEALNKFPSLKKVLIQESKTVNYYDDNLFPYNIFTSLYKSNDSKPARLSIYNCSFAYNDIIDEIEKSNIQYEYFIHCRNDLILEISDIDILLSKVKEGFLCIPPNLWCKSGDTHINDHFLIGRYTYLKNALYFNSINELQSIVASSWNQEETTYNLIKRANQPLFVFDVDKYIVLRHPPFK